MKVRWFGVCLVVLLVLCILWLKTHVRHKAETPTIVGSPAVVLVADLREADDPTDRCAVIIRAVREASRRGVRVAELPPNSNSDLLSRYHVLTIPTVLLLDTSGNVIGRFEGEDANAVTAVQTRLSALAGNKP